MIVVTTACTDSPLQSLTFAGGMGKLCVTIHFDGRNSTGPTRRESLVTLPMGRVTVSHNDYQPISMTLAQSAAIQSP